MLDETHEAIIHREQGEDGLFQLRLEEPIPRTVWVTDVLFRELVAQVNELQLLKQILGRSGSV